MNYSFFLMSVILLAECFQITTAISGGCDYSKAKFEKVGSKTVPAELCGWFLGPKDKSKPKDCDEQTLYTFWPPNSPKSSVVWDCPAHKDKCQQDKSEDPRGYCG
jgi:hypothetical protein